MTFKKLSILFIVLVLISNIDALSLEQGDLEIKFDDSTLGHDIETTEDLIIINIGGRTLEIVPKNYLPHDVVLELFVEEDFPGARLTMEDQLIVIKHIGQDTVKLYLGKPQKEVLDSRNSLVYVVEHYTPDSPIDDPDRDKGIKRLTAVVKDAEVEIDNGIKLRTDGLKISTKSFLNTGSLDDREIDYIEHDKVTEIFGHTQALVVRNYESFEWDELFDRGFKLFLEYIEPVIELKMDDDYVEVQPETCSKLGFVFFPGFGYDYINEVNEFNNNNGYALGIAYSRNDNFESALKDMKLFINRSKDAGLTPIIRILGNVGGINTACRDHFGIDACDNEGDTLCNGANVINCNNVWEDCNVWQAVSTKCILGDTPSNCDGDYCFGDYAYNEPMETEKVVDFIKKLKTEGVEYIQIWDSPDEYYFTNPLDYEEYVLEIKKSLIDSEIKFVSASIFSEAYFDSLSLDFWENTDYIGSAAYNNLNYKTQIDKINQKTGREYEVFLTKVGYANPSTKKQELINMLIEIKEDTNVKSANIFIANYWNKYETNWFTSKENNWIDSTTRKLEPFALDISEEICN